MSIQNSVVAIYPTHTEADQAVKELQRSGVDMHQLSIVGRGYHTDEHAVGYYNTGDRMKYWGKAGAFWGGFWGILFGSAFFMIPGLGPILAAGPVVAWIVGAVEGAVVVGGVSALGAGLYSMGIPMLKRPAPRAPNAPTSTAPSSPATIHATIGPAAKIGPSPGMMKRAEPNRSPQKPPQNAPILPQYFMRSPVL